MKYKSILGIFAFAIIAFGLASSSTVNATQYEVEGKIRICHANRSNENSQNPYTTNTVSVNAAGNGNNSLNGHLTHTGEAGLIIYSSEIHEEAKDAKKDWGDIIPPTDKHPNGLNWTAEGKAVWLNDCGYIPTEYPVVDVCDPSTKPSGSIRDWLIENDFNYADCFEYVETKECGLFDVDFIRNDTPYVYEFRYVLGSTTPSLADWEGDDVLPVQFEEDEFDGKVEVTYYAVGPEKDYFVGFGIPNIWDGTGKTVEVTTNCEGGSGGYTPEEPKTPETPSTPETPVKPAETETPVVSMLPNTFGSSTPIVASAALSLVAVIAIVGTVVKSRLLS